MTETTSSEMELLAREVDRLRPLHVLAVVACALALGFDLAEFAIGTVLSALFSAPPYSVAPTQLSWLLASVYLGVIAGASAAGWLADRFGRRLVILVALAIIGATSIAAAACSSIVALAIVRGLSGLALGAYPPLMAAYLTDILPSSRRGQLIMATVAIGAIGPPAVIFLVRWLTPLEPFGIEAWRWAFIAGAATAAICLLLFALIPESPRWLASQGRLEAARKAYARFGLMPSGFQHRVGQNKTDAAIQLDGPVFIRRIGFLLLIYFLVPWSTAGFPLLSAVVLVEKGVSVNDSLLYAGVSSFGPTIGTLLAGLAIDRIERKTTLIACASLMALLGFAFDVAELPIWIMSSGECDFVFSHNLVLVPVPSFINRYGAVPFKYVPESSVRDNLNCLLGLQGAQYVDTGILCLTYCRTAARKHRHTHNCKCSYFHSHKLLTTPVQ